MISNYIFTVWAFLMALLIGMALMGCQGETQNEFMENCYNDPEYSEECAELSW